MHKVGQKYQETTQKATVAAAAPAATSAIFPDLTLETIIYLSMSAKRVTTHWSTSLSSIPGSNKFNCPTLVLSLLPDARHSFRKTPYNLPVSSTNSTSPTGPLPLYLCS